MPLIKTSYLKRKAKQHFKYNTFEKSFNSLNESMEKLAKSKNHDIFISHSFDDAELVFGLKEFFEEQGYVPYVDWIDDNYLNREIVNKETAKILKNRLQNCKCLIFATSINSTDSLWMPWELGYFDGYKGKVAILPLNDSIVDRGKFHGQEYLGLYPYLDYENEILFVNDNENYVDDFESWLNKDNRVYSLKKMKSRL